MSIEYPLVFDYTLYDNLLFNIQTSIYHVKKYETLCNVTCQRLLDYNSVMVVKGEILALTLGRMQLWGATCMLFFSVTKYYRKKKQKNIWPYSFQQENWVKFKEEISLIFHVKKIITFLFHAKIIFWPMGKKDFPVSLLKVKWSVPKLFMNRILYVT